MSDQNGADASSEASRLHRESVIIKGVSFLKKASMRGRSKEQLVGFLREKMTEAEVEETLRRCELGSLHTLSQVASAASRPSDRPSEPPRPAPVRATPPAPTSASGLETLRAAAAGQQAEAAQAARQPACRRPGRNQNTGTQTNRKRKAPRSAKRPEGPKMPKQPSGEVQRSISKNISEAAKSYATDQVQNHAGPSDDPVLLAEEESLLHEVFECTALAFHQDEGSLRASFAAMSHRAQAVLKSLVENIEDLKQAGGMRVGCVSGQDLAEQAKGAGGKRLPALLRGHIAQGAQSDNIFERPRLWRAVSDDVPDDGVQQDQLPTSPHGNDHTEQLPSSPHVSNADEQIIRAISIECEDVEIQEENQISEDAQIPEDVEISD